MLKVFAGTKLASFPRTRWSTWNFNAGRVETNLGSRPVDTEQCEILIRVFQAVASTLSYPQVDSINWTEPLPADEGLGQADPGAGAGHQDTSERASRSEGGACFLFLSGQSFWFSKAMVDTYKSNPSFADAKTKAKVSGEYETVAQKVSDSIVSNKHHGCRKNTHIPQGEPGGRNTVRLCERTRRDHATDATLGTSKTKRQETQTEGGEGTVTDTR